MICLVRELPTLDETSQRCKIDTMTMTTATKATPTLDELRSGPPTLSIEQAARYLGVSRAYGYTMAREGRLPTIKSARSACGCPRWHCSRRSAATVKANWRNAIDLDMRAPRRLTRPSGATYHR